LLLCWLIHFRPWRWKRYDLPNYCSLLYGVISQKFVFFTVTSVRTSDQVNLL
jgi:hypothetical protein